MCSWIYIHCAFAFAFGRGTMKIRTITVGLNLELPLEEKSIAATGVFMQRAKQAFEDAGFEVQTTRLTIQPLSDLLAERDQDDSVTIAKDLETACLKHAIEYVCLGTIFPDQSEILIERVPDILAATERCFISVTVATPKMGIHLPAIERVADVIKRNSEIASGGVRNHNFAVIANCPPGIPFFPAAYHQGAKTNFTLGLEAANLFVEIFNSAISIAEARTNLVRAVEDIGRKLDTIALALSQQYGIAFGGLDFSTAPFPIAEISTANAIEQLGVEKFGAHGTLFAAALITDTLRHSNFNRAGFSGLFLPVMEDSVLALRNSEGLYTSDSLLLYSTVCGTGLDMIPLPGDISTDELAAMLLDMSTLALLLDKPLTSRLLPIPGKKEGQMTEFNSPYVANTRIMRPKAVASKGIFARHENVRLDKLRP
jgi:uncharacterized protein